MTFDALCAACTAAELNAALCPGRVQQVVLAAPRAVGLEVYAHGVRHALLLDASATAPRVYSTAAKLRRGVEGETPLLLLLRKYVRDGGLVAVRQPIPYERLLEFEFAHTPHGATVLVVELIGRSSNLILRRADGTILDCLLRVPAAPGAARVLLPGRAYSPPPPQAKLPPLDDAPGAAPDHAARLAALLATPEPLWQALVGGVLGISPPLARELAWRAAGTRDAPAAATPLPALRVALAALWGPLRSGAWQPGLLRDAAGRAVAYAPYQIHSLEGAWQPCASLSEAIAAVAAEQAAQIDAPAAPPADTSSGAHAGYAALRAGVAALLETARAKLDRQLAALAGDEPAPGAADTLRTQAAWLLALQHRIAPGQTHLELSAEETGGPALMIALDLARPPAAQAAALFARAAKLERAAVQIPARRAQLQADRDYVAQLAADLAQAQSQPEIAAVRDALYAARLLPPPGGKPARTPQPSGPRRYTVDGCTILVGRNAAQNDRLTLHTARPDDLWLHVRGQPGSHVVLQAPPGVPVPAQAVTAAARLAAYYSTARGESAADVIVTARRYISKPHGARPGQVHVRQESTLRVPTTLPEDLAEVN